MSKKEIKRVDLSKPFNPSDIKGLKEKELEVLSEDIRQNIVQSCACNGGHLSSSLGATDLIVAIHHFFNLPTDKVIFDVGHQAYAHKILSGRTLDKLRKEDGVAGFQKREESEFDPYEAGHSSTSISAAMGLALARDLNKEKYNVIAVIGDSSVANGVSFEAINNLVNFNHKVIVIINDNNRSIAKAAGFTHNFFEKFRLKRGYLRAKDFYKRALYRFGCTRWIYKCTKAIKDFFKYILTRRNIFSRYNLYYIQGIDGHDIGTMERAFKYAVNAPTSVIIHVTTTKGKGYKYSEKDENGEWHGVEPFDVETGKPIKPNNPNEISWSALYAKYMEKNMEIDEKMVIVNPATTIGSAIEPFFSKYKDRCFDVGIAEEHAAVFSSGIAAGGYHPYFSVYSTFLQRSYDEISHDVARMNLNVTIMIDRVGLPGGDGETHEGIFDVAYLSSMPNMAIAMAKDMAEAKQLFDFSTTYDKPLAIRYPKGKTLIMEDSNLPKLKLGEWKVENKGNSGISIISYGPVVNDLIVKYKGYTLVNAIFNNPIDLEVLKSLTNDKAIVIYDIYGTEEGFASIVLKALNNLEYKGKIKIVAVPNVFIKQGCVQNQLKELNIDLDSFDKCLKELDK